MSQRVNIPSQNQPFRRQSSIGGNVSFRNIGENEDNSFITLAKVTRVYYKQGKLDFKLTNTNSLVADQSGNGSGSAPIPVDFFGRRPNGKVFGHYRPVKIGDLIAVAYVNGHKSSPIVIGVYPNSGQDYEIISPSLYLDGDDNNSGIAETALAEQKIYPSMQLEYRSGSGTIAKALNGHSFLVVDDETSVQYSKLWQNYNTVGFFHSDSDDINPLKETAGDWLLVHEDNPLSDDGDNHRTRFFVNKKGEIQIVLMDNTSSGTISVLEGSKDNGFTISQYYDLTKTKSGDLSDDVYEPDFKSATDYVSLNIGKGKQIALDAAGQTKLVIKKDGIYYNGNTLSKAVINSESNNITKYVKDQIISSDYWKNFQDTINKASSEARDAAEQAKQAGENAKAAGAAAEAAGKNALDTGDNIKKNVIYYANKYKGLHPGLHLDGDVVAITGKSYIEDSVINSAMIENGAIDHAKIANEAVWSSQIANLAVTRAKIADAAIGSAQIEDLAVTDEKVGSLSADKLTTGTLDAGKINVIHLNAKSITAGTITADKLKIGELGDITDKLGTIADGKIIVKGNGSNSGVSLEGLDADNPDVYTPSKKAALANIVHAIESSAEASLDYAKQVGLSNDPAAIDLQNTYDAMVKGLAPLFKVNDMGVSTKFDHNTVEQLTSDCNKAIDAFQNLANSQLNRKIGQTADNKNSVYQGYEQPANPHINDIWFQENSDGTYQIKVYDGGSWVSPGMKDIQDVQKEVKKLPRSYYSSTQPAGTDYKDGDIWYKTSTDTTNNTVVYTAYKWNRNTNTWDPLLDATSSHNYVGSAPANPINGDFWMDNTTLKQYQNGVWKTIPTQGPQGVPGTNGKDGETSYIHTAYANSSDGKTNFSLKYFANALYIGMYTDFTEADSDDYTKYTWSRLKGNDGTDGKDGVPGAKGADGRTSYVHFAYANSSDGKINFNLEYFANALYIGTYTDFNEEDSKDHTKYTWSRLKGDPGANGKDGVAGKDGVGLKRTEVTYGLSGSDSTQPSRWSSQVPDLVKGQYLWSKTVWTYTDDTSETGYQKTYIAKDGNDGTDGVAGKDGVGISSTTITYAVGTSGTTAPTSGWDRQVPNVPTGQYLWTKTIWSYTDNTNETGYSVAKMGDTGPKGDPGKDGVPGPKGADGISTYVWIMYSNSESGDPMFRSPVGATYIGIATGKTSSNESSVPTDYKWTKIKGDQGIQGPQGTDGKTPYVHIAYANSADGSGDSFTTDGTKASQATINNDPYQYMGTYVDYNQTSSQDHTMYKWTMIYDKSKKRNFTDQPTTPYNVGDTWTQSGATYFCTCDKLTGAFDASDWTMQQLTIHSLAPSVTNSLYNDNLLTGTSEDEKSGKSYNFADYQISGGLQPGTTYTLSGWARVDQDSLNHHQNVFVCVYSEDWSWGATLNINSALTSQYNKITFTTPNGKQLHPYVTVYLSHPDGGTNDKNNDSISGMGYISKLKLEKGTVATPWCLSQSELTTTTRDYRGVTLNDNGLTATAGSTRVAMNSNDGFLINNPKYASADNPGGQVFHVDTNGNLNMKGAIMSEGTISGVNFTGNNLTLNNSLQVINGNISADNGNVVINSNGLTIKGGGLRIINKNTGQATTLLNDDGTFSTIQGDFAGSVHATSLNLTGKDAYMDVGAGRFHVYSDGRVTATSISITGNRKDDVSNQALIKGANITDGNIIKGNLIEGNNIIGNRIQSSEFMTSTREYSNGSYYPISGSIYTPSFLIGDSGNISVHTVFPQDFSTVARIGSNKGVDGPYVNITHEAFDRSTLSGSFGYGRGYEYPVPYLYGHQGGMVEYPVNSNELSIVYMNDISRSEYNGYGLYDGYKYTEIATINDIVQKYKSKIGRIKFNFGIVCTYGSYDTSEGTTVAGGDHDLYVVLTTGRINENDTYHVDFDGKTFNNVKNNIKIKMTSKKVLTGVGGLSYYNLYAELSTKDLDLANTYYLGVLQKGFIKDSRESLANHTWKIQIDEMAIIPEGDILDDQGYYVPTAGGSYRDLAISANGSIISHEDDIGVQTTSEYNSRYLSFAVSTDGQSPMPYWTTINADGIGFSIGNNNSSTDGNGNPNGLATRQCIYFSGDTNQNGMSMDNFGNIHAQVGAGIWRVYNNQGDEVFDVPFDPNGVFNFYVPRVNKNTHPEHKWGGLKIGWVYFDQPQYRWAETVPAIYNTGGRVKGFAMFGDFIISFVDGWCYQLSSWWNHGVPNGVDISKGEAEGTNTDAGHRGV